MLRTLLLIVPVFALLVAGCGGGGDGKDEANGAEAGASGPTTPTPTPQLLPTPPKALDDEVVLSVSSGENAFTPTLAEFKGLPRTKVDAKGEKEGVSLTALAERVSAASDSYVTLQGYRADGRMIAFIRQPLAEIGSESVLMLDETGRLYLVSSKIPEDSWLINVTMVSFP